VAVYELLPYTNKTSKTNKLLIPWTRKETTMTRELCDDCGELLAMLHPEAELLAPDKHPFSERPYVAKLDFCDFCIGRLLEAYAEQDQAAIDCFWAKVKQRERKHWSWAALSPAGEEDPAPTGA
jgi:hypothetical protein